MLNLPHKKSEDRNAAVTVQNQYVQNSTETCQSTRCRGVNTTAKCVDFGSAHACLVMEKEIIEIGNRWLCMAALATVIQSNGQRAIAALLEGHGTSRYSLANLNLEGPSQVKLRTEFICSAPM